MYQEPVDGLNNRVWSFKVEREYIVNFSHFRWNQMVVMAFLILFKIAIKEDKYSDGVTGRVRLTSEGTDHFERLNNTEL